MIHIIKIIKETLICLAIANLIIPLSTFANEAEADNPEPLFEHTLQGYTVRLTEDPIRTIELKNPEKNLNSRYSNGDDYVYFGDYRVNLLSFQQSLSAATQNFLNTAFTTGIILPEEIVNLPSIPGITSWASLLDPNLKHPSKADIEDDLINAIVTNLETLDGKRVDPRQARKTFNLSASKSRGRAPSNLFGGLPNPTQIFGGLNNSMSNTVVWTGAGETLPICLGAAAFFGGVTLLIVRSEIKSQERRGKEMSKNWYFSGLGVGLIAFGICSVGFQ